MRDAVAEILRRRLEPHGLKQVHVSQIETYDGQPMLLAEASFPAGSPVDDVARREIVRLSSEAGAELMGAVRSIQPDNIAVLRLHVPDPPPQDTGQRAA
jgi:hypothetical protein